MIKIDVIYQQRRFRDYCRKVAGKESLEDDLLQHTAIKIVESKKLDQMKTEDDLFRFFKVIAWREFNTKSIYFNRLYGREKEVVKDVIELKPDQKNRFVEFLDKKLQEKPKNQEEFICKEIFLLYLKHKSIRKVAQVEHIEKETVFKAVKHFKKLIEDEYRIFVETDSD